MAVCATAVVTDSYGPTTIADLPGPIFNSAGVTATTPVGPPPSPVTNTHTVNITPPAQFVEGVVYFDVGGDGVYTPGVDTPLPNVTVGLSPIARAAPHRGD